MANQYRIPEEDCEMDLAKVVERDAFALQKPMNRVIDFGTSDIQNHFRGSTVLVTGATGFLGKLLVEKLLRACEIKRLYLPIRVKKGKSVEERLKFILSDPLFDTLREKKPHFTNIIVPVNANVGDIRLSLSDKDWTKITKTVDTIFHLAATTKFDEHIRIATLINVRGTREILKLAKECKNFRSFVHVSTAYSTATRSRINGHIYETFYRSPIKPEALIQFAENFDENKLDDIAKLMEDWPNTYAFTKFVAEDLVRTFGADLPICVIRPPIVCSAYYEPAPGWVDMNAVMGPTGVYLGAILGVIHVLNALPLKQVFMPADYVTNATIAAGWWTANKVNVQTTADIYTISSIRSTQECGWGNIVNTLRSPEVLRVATPNCIWYPFSYETSYGQILWLLTWLLHYIPAYVLDFVFFLFRLEKPKGISSFVAIYTKIYKLSLLNGYFLTNEWYFKDDNTLKLHNMLSEADKAIFNFDITTIDWKFFVYTWGVGVRKYIIKDGLENSQYGYRKLKWLRVANYIFMTLYAYVIWKIFSLFWNVISTFIWN